MAAPRAGEDKAIECEVHADGGVHEDVHRRPRWGRTRSRPSRTTGYKATNVSPAPPIPTLAGRSASTGRQGERWRRRPATRRPHTPSPPVDLAIDINGDVRQTPGIRAAPRFAPKRASCTLGSALIRASW